MADEIARNSVPDEMLQYPVTSDTSGVAGVTAISPTTLNLTRGGASGTINITGVNLSASDTWSTSNSNVTISAVVNSATSVTLTVTAAVATPRANYDLKFNGDTLTPRGIFKVR